MASVRERSSSAWARNMEVLKRGTVQVQGTYVKWWTTVFCEVASNGKLLLFASEDPETRPSQALVVERVLRSDRAMEIYVLTDDDDLVVLRGPTALATSEWRAVIEGAARGGGGGRRRRVSDDGTDGIELRAVVDDGGEDEDEDEDGLSACAENMFEAMQVSPTGGKQKFRLNVFVMQLLYHVYPLGTLLCVLNEGVQTARNQALLGSGTQHFLMYHLPYLLVLAVIAAWALDDHNVWGLQVAFMAIFVHVRVCAIAWKYSFMAPGNYVAIITARDSAEAHEYIVRALLLMGAKMEALDGLMLELSSAALQSQEPDDLLARRFEVTAANAARFNDFLRPPEIDMDVLPGGAMRVPPRGGSVSVHEVALARVRSGIGRTDASISATKLRAAALVQSAIPWLACWYHDVSAFNVSPVGIAAQACCVWATLIFFPMCISFFVVAVGQFWRRAALLEELGEVVSGARPLIGLTTPGNVRAWLALHFIVRKTGVTYQARMELVSGLIALMQAALSVALVALVWSDSLDLENSVEQTMLSLYVLFDLAVFAVPASWLFQYGDVANGSFADHQRVLAGLMVVNSAKPDAAGADAMHRALAAGVTQLGVENEVDPMKFLGVRIDQNAGLSLLTLLATAAGSFASSLMES